MSTAEVVTVPRIPVLGRIEVAGRRLLVRPHGEGWVFLDEEMGAGLVAFGMVELHDHRAVLMLHPSPAPWCVRNSPLADRITNEVQRIVATPIASTALPVRRASVGRVVYHCFTTDSDDASMGFVPPMRARDWLHHRNLRVAVRTDEAAALRWLWEQLRTAWHDTAPGHRPDIDAAFALAATALAHGDLACQWTVDLPDRSRRVIAVVAQYTDCAPPRIPVPPTRNSPGSA